MAASKVRPLADIVRRKPYVDAVAILAVQPNKGSKLLKKAIESAAANAMYQNKQLDETMLYVKELMIDEGPKQVRIWPRARGRADKLIKRSCHISVVVDEIGGNK